MRLSLRSNGYKEKTQTSFSGEDTALPLARTFIDLLEEKLLDNLRHRHRQSDSVRPSWLKSIFLDACSGTDSYVIDSYPMRSHWGGRGSCVDMREVQHKKNGCIYILPVRMIKKYFVLVSQCHFYFHILIDILI